MLLVVPEVPNQPSGKPLLQGFGCRLRDGALSCETLFVDQHIPAQVLMGELHERHKPPVNVRLDWTPLPPGLHGRVVIDLEEET